MTISVSERIPPRISASKFPLRGIILWTFIVKLFESLTEKTTLESTIIDYWSKSSSKLEKMFKNIITDLEFLISVR